MNLEFFIRYDSYLFRHSIRFDTGGNEINYDMNGQRFRITGADELENGYWPTSTYGSAVGAASYVWTPYVSRTPNARTEVTFHVLLDHRMLTPGDYVRLNGNLQELSAWNDGVPMVAESDNRQIWSVTVELPFTMADFWNLGMFQYQYEIVSGSGVIREGQAERSEQRLKSHFYHAFRPNFKNARQSRLTALPPKVIIEAFVSHEILGLKSGSMELKDFVDRFTNLSSSVIGNRGFVEDLFDEEIEEADKEVCLLS